jgi:hypothetical protein
LPQPLHCGLELALGATATSMVLSTDGEKYVASYTKPLIGCTLLSILLSVTLYMRDWYHSSRGLASPSVFHLVTLVLKSIGTCVPHDTYKIQARAAAPALSGEVCPSGPREGGPHLLWLTFLCEDPQGGEVRLQSSMARLCRTSLGNRSGNSGLAAERVRLSLSLLP